MIEKSPYLPKIQRLTQELSEQEPWLRLVWSVVEKIKLGAVITDTRIDPPGPQILYVNPAFEKWTGYSREEIYLKTPRILQGPLTDRSTLDMLREAMEDNQPFEGETINYKKDGTPYRVHWDLVPCLGDNGEPVYWLALQNFSEMD